MIALERFGEGLLVDDLTPGDVDEHAPCLHRCKTFLVEETGRLRCPLAADHHEIALRQEPIEIPGAAKLAESRGPGPVRGGGGGGAGGGWWGLPPPPMPRAAQGLPTPSPIPRAPTTHAVLPSNRSGRYARWSNTPTPRSTAARWRPLAKCKIPASAYSAIASVSPEPREVVTPTRLPHKSLASRLLAPAGR